jgi:hypothetical protein
MTTNSSWKAFSLGLRWGCGHSIGLVIMALIFFAAGQTVNLNSVGVYCNYVVGVFMIALGAWTARHVRRKYITDSKEALLASSVPSERLLPARTTGRSSSNAEHVPFAVTPLTPAQRAPRRSSGSGHDESEVRRSEAAAPSVAAALSPTPSSSSYHVLMTVDGGREETHSASPASSRVPSLRLETATDKQEDESSRPKWCCKCCPTASFSNPTTQRVRSPRHHCCMGS